MQNGTRRQRRLISRKQARVICDLSERSQRRSPDFPKAVEISPGRMALVEDEVLDWLERRIAARDAALAGTTTPPPSCQEGPQPGPSHSSH